MSMEEGTVVEVPKIIVKTLSDRAINIELSDSLKTIKDAKVEVEKHTLLPLSKQLLILNGKVLSDNDPLPTPSTNLYLFYYEPTALKVDSIEKAVDWESKNRMKVFKGLYLISRRKFAEAAPLLIDSLATFAETNFIPFKDCVKYATIVGMLVLDRTSLQKSLVKSPEVLEVIHELPHMESFINSFYNCRYAEFFVSLANLEVELAKDWLLSAHTQFIIKEMRIRAYNQLLQAYRSMTISSMALNFGVTPEFIDRELSRFINAGRIACVIDKVSGMIITEIKDKRSNEFQTFLKQSDTLADRLQKIGRQLSY